MANGIFLDAITTVRVSLKKLGFTAVVDPRNVRPGTVFIELPTFDSFNYNIADIRITIRVIAAPPGNSDATDWILQAVDKIMNSEMAVLDGRPGMATYGNQDLPTYDLTIGVAMRRN